MRELRNLAESIVVLSLGSRIRARDIPDQIYRRGNPQRLLPVRFGEGGGRGEPREDQRLEFQLLYQAMMNLQREMSEIRRMLAEGYRPQPEGGYREREAAPPAAPHEPSHPEQDISRLGSVHFAEEAEEAPRRSQPSQQSMEEIERGAIVRTLAAVDGNRRKAARILGIGERTLYRKLREYGLK